MATLPHPVTGTASGPNQFQMGQLVITNPSRGALLSAIPKPKASVSAPRSPGSPAQPVAHASAVTDPYAQWGGAAQYNSYMNQYHSGVNNVEQGAADNFANTRLQLQGGAEDVFNKYRTGQQGIDTGRATNELGRMNGISDIVNYVRQGLDSGMRRLSNGNALDSSAGDQFNRLYAKSGSNKARGVNNAAAITSANLDQNQNELNNQRDLDVNAFHRTRDQAVNSIGADVRDKLSALDQTAMGLSLPDRVNVEQEKQKVVNAGLAQLAEIDNWLSGQLGSVHPLDSNGVIAKANELRSLGTATGTPFDAANGNNPNITQQPVGGPAIDQLPLFVNRKKFTQ